ncbi:hypothetical protein [Paracoccus marcusii]
MVLAREGVDRSWATKRITVRRVTPRGSASYQP